MNGSGRRWRYQSPFWRHGVFFAVFAVASGYYAIDTTIKLLWTPEQLQSTVGGLIGGASMWALTGLCVRATISGVYAGPNRATLIGVFRTHRLSWRDIARVRLGDWGPFPGAMAVVDLVDGRSYRIFGIGRPNPISERQDRPSVADRIVDELNARIREEREVLGSGLQAPIRSASANRGATDSEVRPRGQPRR